MSWQAYVDTSLVGSGNIDKAAIFNAEGTSCWASSSGFTVTPQEVTAVVASLSDPSDPKKVMINGFHLQNIKYMAIKAENERLYGKQGKEGIVIVKTKQALLIAHHPASVTSQAAANTVEALGEYMKSVGY